jgi:hypothetical protein
MNHPESPHKELRPDALVKNLARGWTSSHDGWAQELLKRWAAQLNARTDVRDVGEGVVQFVTYFSNIYLRTMNEVPCLLAGDSADIGPQVQKFWKANYSQTSLPFILALSDAANEAARATLSADSCVILSAGQVCELLKTARARHTLTGFIRQQISRRKLSPYDILIPALKPMFFGREEELDRLLEQDFLSFSVAGPGGIGKTSLIKQYKMERLLRNKGRTDNVIYLSCLAADKTADGTAQFIAMQIEDSRRSYRMTPPTLVNFLRTVRNARGGPLDLLLDEVDEVCEGPAFQFLGEAARLKLCRLILCGRGRLLQMMFNSASPLGRRLHLIHLGPLKEQPARDLLVEPLTDLGFDLPDPGPLAERVLSLTGRLPHHIQLFAMNLAELAIKNKTNTISSELLEELLGDLFITHFYKDTLLTLGDVKSRLIGLALVAEGRRQITPGFLSEVAMREGIKLDYNGANTLCLDLVINNLLIWDDNSFRFANEALFYYAEKIGFLSEALAEARQEWRRGPKAAA